MLILSFRFSCGLLAVDIVLGHVRRSGPEIWSKSLSQLVPVANTAKTCSDKPSENSRLLCLLKDSELLIKLLSGVNPQFHRPKCGHPGSLRKTQVR